MSSAAGAGMDPIDGSSRVTLLTRTACHLCAPVRDVVEGIELEDKDAASGGNGPHSVLTINLKDSPGEPTKLAEERVIQFFKQRTGA